MKKYFAALLLTISTLTFTSCKDEITNGGITSCDFPALLATEDSCTVALPNMFTPNGDGINDAFGVMIINTGVAPIENLHIVIQNEAATTVAEGFDESFLWDGEAGGGVNFGVFTVNVTFDLDAQPYEYESYLYCLPYNSSDYTTIDCSDCLFATQWDGASFNSALDNSEDVCE